MVGQRDRLLVPIPEELTGEHSDRLEHCEAALAVRAMPNNDEAPIDEILEDGQDIALRPSAPFESLDLGEPGPADEDGHPPEEAAHLLGQKVIAPADGRAQRPLSL